MDKERRGAKTPVPTSLDETLNHDQLLTLRQLENFGWRIAFVRRPLFQEVVVVITSADGEKTGILETDGQLNMQPNIRIRE
jgi:hypothetical protein